MVGLELPVLAMEHHYILTEDMPEIAEINRSTGKEIVHAIDFAGEIYTRQERGGMLLGTYEKAADAVVAERRRRGISARTCWRPTSTASRRRWRSASSISRRCSTPASERSSTAPFTFSPDGNPLVGPVRGLKNFWCACAVMAGFSQGGGVGLALSNWMVDGDPGFDVWGMDVARFGPWATLGYTNAKVRENLFAPLPHPLPERGAAGGAADADDAALRQDDRAGRRDGRQLGAGDAALVRAEGRRAEGHRLLPPLQRFRAREARGARRCAKSVGVTEIANFAKYAITGPGAEAFLSRLMTNRMPKAGRIVLTPMLNEKGKLIGDFTIAKAPPRTATSASSCGGRARRRSITCAGSSGTCRDDGSVSIRPLGMDLVGLSIAGPNARKVLAKLTDEDVSTEAFRFLDFRETHLAAVPVMINRVTYTGDLGYEIWVKPEYRAAALRAR